MAISAGQVHSLALKADGTLWAWGANGNYQLGLGDTTQRSVPTQVVGATDLWVAVAAGYDNSLALKSDGTLWGWGLNNYEQSGPGGPNITAPTRIGTASDWMAVSPGETYTLAKKADGTLWAWGDNTYGQLGVGDEISRSTLTQFGIGPLGTYYLDDGRGRVRQPEQLRCKKPSGGPGM